MVVTANNGPANVTSAFHLPLASLHPVLYPMSTAIINSQATLGALSNLHIHTHLALTHGRGRL